MVEHSLRRAHFIAVALLAMMVTAAPGGAQLAATLPLLDPAYEQLAVLEAYGLVPSGLSAIRPLSVRRVARLVEDARGWLRANPHESPRVRADTGVLTRTARATLLYGSGQGSDSSPRGRDRRREKPRPRHW